MFTGIVEGLGQVSSTRDEGGMRQIRITAEPRLLEGLVPGSSIAVDGACLTPVRILDDGFVVDAVGTTLSRTVAGGYRVGSRVNLERALPLGGRLEGHLVQGHVDGVGVLEGLRKEGGFRLLEVSVPREVHELTLVHGSIALNGVSLTVNRLGAGGIVQVALIPHTWSHTNFQFLEVGDPLNIEGDLIGKYVGKLLRVGKAQPPGASDGSPAPEGRPGGERGREGGG